ncbi:hypothetical protein L486_07346 [Kwoniella mangroviensis CBS 10435]|uniref:Uncharacterized protein n=1 Tax=Kwoniella mangroviensis CBS 10435 TaxID=1331196 RepID=A0A1B9IIC4_9TREE|nr:hypothetical protein L486_07346 [Kwoniella mangroviensis CBS 10435]
MFFVDRLPLPFLKKEKTLKDRAESRKMRVPGYNKLYFIVFDTNNEKYQKVLDWLNLNKFYAFAANLIGSELFVIIADNGPFPRTAVVTFLEEDLHKPCTLKVEYAIYNQPPPSK